MDTWLKHLEVAPSEAFVDLVHGRADVGVYSRASLAEILLFAYRSQRGALDEGAWSFLSNHLLGEVPDWMSPQVWGSRLQEVFRGLTSLELEKTNRLLRQQHRKFRLWLSGLASGPSLDPEVEYLRALAWSQNDASLIPFWRKLALREEGKGADWVEVGLLGLRKAKGANAESPNDVPSALIAAIIDLTALPDTDPKWWIRKVHALRSAYGLAKDDWRMRLELAATNRRDRGKKAVEWLTEYWPGASEGDPRQPLHGRNQKISNLRPPTTAEADRIDSDLLQRGPHSMGERLDKFLSQHREYAADTGDGYYLVRAFHRLAEKAMRHDTVWALAIIDEALTWTRGDAFLWNAKAHCYESAGNYDAASETLWAARIEIPRNAHIRTELGGLLRRGGDLQTSRIIFEEGQRDFPANLVVWTGHAEVLLELDDIDEAIHSYRKALQIDEDDLYSRNGLAKALAKRGREDDLRESEVLLRDACASPNCNAVSWNTLAELLKDQERFDEAIEICHMAADKFPDDPICRSILGEVLYILSARNEGNIALKKKAVYWLQEASYRGNDFAKKRLATFEGRWDLAILRGGERVAVAGEKERETTRRVHRFRMTEQEWSPAQRLGRSLLAQWQATRADDPEYRKSLFQRAESLLALELSEDDDYFAAFIEARGFLLLARGYIGDALVYFTEQQERHGRKGWEGIRLGLIEARIRSSQPVDSVELRRLEKAGPEGAITPLIVRVLNGLAKTVGGDEELREDLATLFPYAAKKVSARGKEAVSAHSKYARGPQIDDFLGDWVRMNWFEPAMIETVENLNDSVRVNHLRKAISKTDVALWQSLHNVPLALTTRQAGSQLAMS